MLRGDTGVLLKAGNGTVIAYDATGLILKLSDATLADLRRRLGAANGPAAEAARIDPAVVGDIDAWNLRREGEFFSFDAVLPGYLHPRRFRRPVTGGDILADTAGPILGLFSLGGARRARGVPARAAFPAHVLAPGDELGAVGAAGEPAAAVDGVQQVGEGTLDTLTADALLRLRQGQGRSLPLILTRCESDDSGSAQALARGAALANLEQAIRNLAAAAARLGTRARIAAISLDFAAEDVIDDAQAHVAALRSVMDRIAALAGELGLRAPPFLMHADDTGRRVREHWQLSVFPGVHDLIFTAPGYMFDHDPFHRPTPRAMAQMAQIDASAIAAAETRQPWRCPRLLLAETADFQRLHVTCDALEPLKLDRTGLSGVAPDFGFEVWQGGAALPLKGIGVDPQDSRALRIDLAAPAQPRPLELRFAVGRRGGLRDAWATDFGEGRLHRWALPAILPVQRC